MERPNGYFVGQTLRAHLIVLLKLNILQEAQFTQCYQKRAWASFVLHGRFLFSKQLSHRLHLSYMVGYYFQDD